MGRGFSFMTADLTRQHALVKYEGWGHSHLRRPRIQLGLSHWRGPDPRSRCRLLALSAQSLGWPAG